MIIDVIQLLLLVVQRCANSMNTNNVVLARVRLLAKFYSSL